MAAGQEYREGVTVNKGARGVAVDASRGGRGDGREGCGGWEVGWVVWGCARGGGRGVGLRVSVWWKRGLWERWCVGEGRGEV